MKSKGSANDSPKKPKTSLKKKIELVAGGEHRQQSVEQALNAISAAADDVVLVHDAVRPLVTAEIINEVIEAAKKYGAAIAGLPAVDTVKQVERTSEGAIVKATIPRAGIVLAQTPQGFHYSVIKKAFDEAAADGFTGTDEASLAERSGHQVAVVMGSPRNIKITDSRRHGTGRVLFEELHGRLARRPPSQTNDRRQPRTLTTHDPNRLRL